MRDGARWCRVSKIADERTPAQRSRCGSRFDLLSSAAMRRLKTRATQSMTHSNEALQECHSAGDPSPHTSSCVRPAACRNGVECVAAPTRLSASLGPARAGLSDSLNRIRWLANLPTSRNWCAAMCRFGAGRGCAAVRIGERGARLPSTALRGCSLLAESRTGRRNSSRRVKAAINSDRAGIWRSSRNPSEGHA